MKKKQKIKYLIAIYGIIASISVILWLLAFNRGEDIYQATLINLATEVFGVVLIFFIVNYLFTLSDWELSERVENLLLKLDHSESTSVNNFFHDRLELGPLINEARRIDLCGIVLATTIDSNIIHIKDSLSRGTNIRILIIQLNDENVKSIDRMDYGLDFKSANYYVKKHESVTHNIKSLILLSEKFKGKLEVGVLPYIPSYGIKIFDKNKKDSKCVIELYGYRAKIGFLPNLSINKSLDEKWHNYFQDQFDIMWSHREKFN